MTVTINGTTGITSPGGDTSTSLATTNLSYTGTLTGGTGVIAIGTNQIYKDSSGNVGIGVTPSGWTSGGAATLQIKNSGFSGIGNDTHVSSNAYYDGANWRYIAASVVASNCYQSAGAHVWRTTGVTTGTVGSTIAWSTPMTLDASGNLGVGAASSGAKINSTCATNIAGIRVTDGTYAGNITPSSLGGMALVVEGAYPQIFYINGGERARIDSSGALIVGNATTITGNSNTKFAVRSSSATSTTRTANQNAIISSVGSGADVCLQFTDAVTYNYYFGGYNGTAYVTTGNSGGVKLAAAATAWAADSDERLKTDLKPIESAAEKVSTLRAVTGRYKTDEESISRSFLIAQDVQKVLPEAIDETDPDSLGVRYTEVIPLLVAAIKELTTRLEALEAKA